MKRRELYGNILMIAVATLISAWTMFTWTSCSGVTFVGSRGYQRARNATERDRTRARHIAVLATVIAAPVALWAAHKRKES